MIHEHKILPQYFEAVQSGLKTFEIRKNDRDYKVGDTLVLKEYNNEAYTGREIRKDISYIYEGCGDYGFSIGYCVLGLVAERKPERIKELKKRVERYEITIGYCMKEMNKAICVHDRYKENYYRGRLNRAIRCKEKNEEKLAQILAE